MRRVFIAYYAVSAKIGSDVGSSVLYRAVTVPFKREFLASTKEAAIAGAKKSLIEFLQCHDYRTVNDFSEQIKKAEDIQKVAAQWFWKGDEPFGVGYEFGSAKTNKSFTVYPVEMPTHDE